MYILIIKIIFIFLILSILEYLNNKKYSINNKSLFDKYKIPIISTFILIIFLDNNIIIETVCKNNIDNYKINLQSM